LPYGGFGGCRQTPKLDAGIAFEAQIPGMRLDPVAIGPAPTTTFSMTMRIARDSIRAHDLGISK
jgi:hypothetical protein